MSTRALAVLTAICGVVAAISVFLPWFSSSFEGFDMPGRMQGLEFPTSQTVNGTDSPFLGVWILVLSLFGVAASGFSAAGRRDLVPITPRQLLLLASILFGIAGVLCIVDVLRDVGAGEMALGDVKIKSGKRFGLFLTLLATLSATCISVGGSLRSEAE
ncbi:MAG: hypothetical protein ACYS99_04310 [Planctomycetota bacterium]|jgi:hypothetical protein